MAAFKNNILKLILLMIGFLVVTLLHRTMKNEVGIQHLSRSIPASIKEDNWENRLNSNTKVIYMYTTLFRLTKWSLMTGAETFKHFDTCPKHTNCLVTYNKTWLYRANAALFSGRDVELYRLEHYSAAKLAEVRKKVPENQKWIFLIHENPQLDQGVYKPYDGLFNWTATFDRRSSVFIPYFIYKENKAHKANIRNYANEKTGLVAWAVSNCGLMREKYVLELEKYIDVTVYGGCSSRFKRARTCQRNSEDCDKQFSSYKFFLAFENDFCQDYVTEKYWLRIMQDVVPVVMGANYDEGLVIPGSYIDANDFDSIQKLAEYLLFLDANDDEYNKYFKYKEKYESKEASFYCAICAALHGEDAKSLTQIDLSKRFNYERNCGIFAAKRARFEKQIQESKNFARSRKV